MRDREEPLHEPQPAAQVGLELAFDPHGVRRMLVHALHSDTHAVVGEVGSVPAHERRDERREGREEARPRATDRRRDHGDVGARSQGDPVHGDRQVDGAAQEGEARGGDLLRLVRRRRRRRLAAGDVRLQRRAGCVIGLPAHGCSRSAARRLPVRRHAADGAGQARRERVLVARVHRPRVRRSRRNRLQPRHRAREEGRRQGRRRQARRRSRSEGVLRLQARSRVALRVHGPLALRERPLGLAGLHRRRELRRLSRRAPRADAPGGRGHRPERRDPHLTRPRDHRPHPDGLRRARLGRPGTDHGSGGVPSRTLASLPQEHVAREGLPRVRGVRDRGLRVVPHSRRVASGEGAHADTHAPGRHPRSAARDRRARRGTRRDAHVRSRAPA